MLKDLKLAQEAAAASGAATPLGAQAEALYALYLGHTRFITRGEFRESSQLCWTADKLLREECTGVAWEVTLANLYGNAGLIHLGEWAEARRRAER